MIFKSLLSLELSVDSINLSLEVEILLLVEPWSSSSLGLVSLPVALGVVVLSLTHVVLVSLGVYKFFDFLLSIVLSFGLELFIADSGGVLSSGNSAGDGVSDSRESLQAQVSENEDCDGDQDAEEEQIIFGEGQSPSMHSYQNISQTGAEGKPVIHFGNQIVALVGVVKGDGEHQGREVNSWGVKRSLVGQVALLSVLWVTAVGSIVGV
jgi:hypothetical protein